MKCPGGYQMVDVSDVTLGTEAVTITNAKNAEILRKTRKPVYFYGAKRGSAIVSFLPASVSDTGAVDGKVYTIIGDQGLYTVTTDDDKVTFTPLA